MCTQALTAWRALGGGHAEADTLDSLGLIHQRRGENAEAISCYRRAIDIFTELGSGFKAMQSSLRLGDLHHGSGDLVAATQAWHAGRELLPCSQSSADIDAVRLEIEARLAGLSPERRFLVVD
jgi:tetratricopeptide (TPR) repeat protein